jgi:hypothetical protein
MTLQIGCRIHTSRQICAISKMGLARSPGRDYRARAPHHEDDWLAAAPLAGRGPLFNTIYLGGCI